MGNSSRARRTYLTAILCAVPVAALVAIAWHRRWVTDDAFIDLRVVSNIHHGLGPVWNPGERVEAFTSPAWIALLWAVWSVFRFVALEWIAVLLGIAATVVGLVAAARGALVLWRHAGRAGIALPLGLVVAAVLRPVWDFTTSGLETGLTFAWLGGSFWAVTVVVTGSVRERVSAGWTRFLPRLTVGKAALLVGLGPLVRPDLAIFSVGFLVVLLSSPTPDGWRPRLRIVALAVAVPLVYEVFRMGYYAALVPNTALAKEASVADWSRGWHYLTDFLDPYYLLIPLALLLVVAVYELRGSLANRRVTLALAVCPVACGLVHALYIVRVGGDFMHGRMLLPSLFGVLLPVSVVPVRRPLAVAGALAVIAWAVVCATSLRPSYWGHVRVDLPVSDEHAYYVALSHNQHPVTLHDYRMHPFAQFGGRLAALARSGRAVVVRAGIPDARAIPDPRRGVPERVLSGAGAVGLVGYAAGPHVYVADQFGLGDPLAARVRLEALRIPGGGVRPKRGRPGHDKYLPGEWVAARFAIPAADRYAKRSPTWVVAARRAIACPPIRRLLKAVDGPMSVDRFFTNVGDSFDLTSLRFSPDPVEAERELCR